MYVLKRTVGTSIVIGDNSSRINLTLVGIDWLGGCALVEMQKEGEPKSPPLEYSSGESWLIDREVRVHILRIAHASHKGISSQVVEFGFEAPIEIPIKLAEKA